MYMLQLAMLLWNTCTMLVVPIMKPKYSPPMTTTNIDKTVPEPISLAANEKRSEVRQMFYIGHIVSIQKVDMNISLSGSVR